MKGMIDLERFARFIVQKRAVVLIIAVLLLIPSVIGYIGTYINYDILSYLPEDLESIQGENTLEKDFHIASTAMITVEHMTAPDVMELKEKLAAIECVDKVIWADDISDVTIPHEMMPEDIEEFFYSGDATLLIVTFKDNSASLGTMNAMEEIKTVLQKNCFLGGMSAIVEDTKALADREMPLYVLIAVLLLLVVLFLGMRSTVVPFIFLMGIAFAIVYNFGTNIFLGQISYITQALATVLQLGVTMDFSIFLLHRYEEEKERGLRAEDAMVNAIQRTFASITGSSLTTIAGFLAMCTMSLALGADIGIVMAKGVLLGVICTVTVLPALLMVFDKAVHKYTHRTFIPKLKRASSFVVKHYRSILIAFIVLVIPFCLAQSKTDVYYTLLDTLPRDLVSIQGTDKLKETFNMTTTHFILVDDSLDNYQVREIARKLEALDGVEQTLAYEKFVGGGIPAEFIPAKITEIFQNGGRKMILANSSFKAGSKEQNQQLEKIQDIVKSYDPNALVTGEGAMTKDLIEVADTDFQNVNLTSILVVFLIVAVVFRSISIPVLLVAAIESAIMINMGIPYFTGTEIPFISSIVVGTIQLGATIDYAILMTTRFREERQNGRDAKMAAQIAVENCSQSILSSGLAFFAATIGVAAISKIQLIKSLCEMISRGALISMFTIIFVFPALLIVFSKLIEKTSYHWLTAQNQKGADLNANP